MVKRSKKSIMMHILTSYEPPFDAVNVFDLHLVQTVKWVSDSNVTEITFQSGFVLWVTEKLDYVLKLVIEAKKTPEQKQRERNRQRRIRNKIKAA